MAVDCRSVYSDVLFHSRRLAAASVDAAWLAGESVPRVAAADLTAEAFRSRHETANTPVVVTGGMALGVGGVDWADVPALVARWGGTRFHVGGYELRLADYVAYATAATDDQALVLFDRAFVEKGGPGMGGGYRVPAVFEEDLFEVLDEGGGVVDGDGGVGNGGGGGRGAVGAPPSSPAGGPTPADSPPARRVGNGGGGGNSGSSGVGGGDSGGFGGGAAEGPRLRRPDYRWLIAGPARSGSTFHTDPNGTSAWNGVLAGTKRWVLFPPGHPPPGVHTTTTTTTTTNATGATAASPNPTATAGSLAGDPPTPTPLTATSVVSPLTPLEWWSTYHAAAVASPHCVQATCTAGDVMFIPSGWWHAVLNVDPWTVAVTQNYVSTANLPRVRHFLHTRRGDVSGVEGGGGVRLAEALDDALRRRRPAVWAAAAADDEAAAAGASAAAATAAAAAAAAAPSQLGTAAAAHGASAHPPSVGGGGARKRPRPLWEILGGTARRGGAARPAPPGGSDKGAPSKGAAAAADAAALPQRVPFTFGF